MIIGTLLLTYLVPVQVHFAHVESVHVELYWVAQAAIDSARLIGLPTYRNKIPLEVLNQELFLREAAKYDIPITRRRQFVQNLVNNSASIATR